MTFRRFISARFVLLALTLSAAALTACSLASSKPTVVISSPTNGSQYKEGDDVAVQSTSADPSGVTRVELAVDGTIILTYTAPSASPSIPLAQTWKAAPGSHTLTVQAYNAAGVASDPVGIAVTVNSTIALVNTPTVTAPNALSTLASTPAAGATSTASSSTATPTLQPATTPSVTPTSTRTSTPTRTPTATSTHTLTPTPCSPPDEKSFSASLNPVWPGHQTTLSWGAVSNATSVTIDQGIGSVAAPGTKVVTLGSTTTYKLTAIGCGGTATFQVTVVVNPNAAPAAQYIPSDTVQIPAHTTQAVSAKCPNGTRVTGGGFVTGLQGMVVSSNEVVTSNTWGAFVANNNSVGTEGINVYAVCIANLPGLVVPVGGVKNDIATNAPGIASAACPPGGILVGGGFHSLNNNPVFSSAPFIGSWMSVTKNYETNSADSLSTIAFCYIGEGASSSLQSKTVENIDGNGGHGLVGTDPCPVGTLLTGGGFQASVGMVIAASYPQSNAWSARAANNSGVLSNLGAIALCTKF